MKIKFLRGTAGIGFGYMEGQELETSQAQALEFVELGFATIIEANKDGLPLDLPGREALLKADIKEIKDIPAEVGALVEINGIGKATAEKIVEYLRNSIK